jgi:hypothetical protein
MTAEPSADGLTPRFGELCLNCHGHNLITRFADYVQSFGVAPAFNDEQLGAHLGTLALRSQLAVRRTP